MVKNNLKVMLSFLFLLSLVSCLGGCVKESEQTHRPETQPVVYDLVNKTDSLEKLAQSMGDDIRFKVNDDGTAAFCMEQGGREVPINEFETVGKAYAYCVSTGQLLENGEIP